MHKIITAGKAAELIEDGEVIAFNGFGSMGFPEPIAMAIGERFSRTGAPAQMTYLAHAGQGVWQKGRMIENMCQPGMVKCFIGGHITPMVNICEQISGGAIEGYNFSMGIMSHLMRASAGRKPGIITKIGLGTFIDPRFGGGALNAHSTQKLVELMEIDGEEYLFYKALKPTCALLRGTTADPAGNITMEKEALYSDAYSTALAVKANGGKVILQVERLSAVRADPRKVKIPGILVDYIVVEKDQGMSVITDYNPAYIGEWVIPEDQVPDMIDDIRDKGTKAGRKRERNQLHEIIARRAAMELSENAIVNLGIGIPEMIPKAAKDMGLDMKYTLTVEGGVVGGTPAPSFDFGCAVNPEMIQDMALQFDLYDSGCLDATFVGAMQIDRLGNVNVSKTGDRVIGVGGFTNLTQSARKVVYCFPFTAGGLEVSVTDGGLHIIKEGRYRKFCSEIDQISASGAYSLKAGQEVLFVTERCVFTLIPGGILLTEIARGVSLEDDILANMDFKPEISEHLKFMDEQLFL